jgi:hypothetical protein
MLSEYAQFQIVISTYFLAVAVIGYMGINLCCSPSDDEQPLFPVPPPPQTGEILWALAGWYKLQSGDYAPLFHSPRTGEWVYVHKGTLVHPTDAAVRRRGVRHPPTTE